MIHTKFLPRQEHRELMAFAIYTTAMGLRPDSIQTA